MKRGLWIALFWLLTYSLYAQDAPPKAINFQGVAIDKNGVPVPGMDELGNPIPNQAIRVRFSILKDSPTGSISYSEEHLTQTDEYGRFNAAIGRGTVSSGSFGQIPWANAPLYLKVEIDLTGIGSDYRLASVQEFLSVPYAMFAQSALSNPNDRDRDSTNELQTLSLTGNLLEISQGNTVSLPSDNDNQQLTLLGSVLSISNGNSISLPADMDAQSLTLSGNTLSISNGNSVSLPPNTDHQTLALSGQALSISNGNAVTLPPPQTLSIAGTTLNISNGNSVALPPNTDHQTLALSGQSLSISNGNSVSLPADMDAQNLALSGNTLSISNGNSVALPPNTDHQTLALSGQSLSISNGNTVTLPVDQDGDPNNEIQTVSLSSDTLRLSKGGGFVKLPRSDRDTTNELQQLSVTNDQLKLSKGNQIELDAINYPVSEFTRIEYLAGRYSNPSPVFVPGPFHVGSVGVIFSDVISFDGVNGFFLSRSVVNSQSYVLAKVNFQTKALTLVAGGAQGLTNGTGSAAGLNGGLAPFNPMIADNQGNLLVAFNGGTIKKITPSGIVSDFDLFGTSPAIMGIYNGANGEIIVIQNVGFGLLKRLLSNGTLITIPTGGIGVFEGYGNGLQGIADSTGYYPMSGFGGVLALTYSTKDQHYYAIIQNNSGNSALIRVKSDWSGFQSVGFFDGWTSSTDGDIYNGTILAQGNRFLQGTTDPRYLYFVEDYSGKVRKIDLERNIIKTVYRHPAIRGCSLIGNRMVVTGEVLAELK